MVKTDHEKHMYVVTYEDAGLYKTIQFSVRDLTSESLTTEKERLKAVARSRRSEEPKGSKIKSKIRRKTTLTSQNTSHTGDPTMFTVTTRVATYDFKYSDLSTITTHNAWLSDANVSTFIYTCCEITRAMPVPQ